MWTVKVKFGWTKAFYLFVRVYILFQLFRASILRALYMEMGGKKEASDRSERLFTYQNTEIVSRSLFSWTHEKTRKIVDLLANTREIITLKTTNCQHVETRRSFFSLSPVPLCRLLRANIKFLWRHTPFKFVIRTFLFS